MKDWTASQPDTAPDGFTRTLVFYERGPGDPPGNGEGWMCLKCDRWRNEGHANDCPKWALAPAKEDQ
jgi:hypothetical protein